MTSVRSRVSALATLIGLLFLVGCGESANEYTLGSGERFCPPSDYDLTEGWGSKVDGRDDGFFVSGCLWDRSCDGRLNDVSSVLVTDWKPRPLHGTSYYEQLRGNGAREYSEDRHRFLVRFKPESRAVFLSEGNDADVRWPLAVCDQQLCSRVVKSGAQEIKYSFATDIEFAGDVASRDRVVVDVINSWKCST